MCFDLDDSEEERLDGLHIQVLTEGFVVKAELSCGDDKTYACKNLTEAVQAIHELIHAYKNPK
jgi:hypothetical protein